MKKLTLTIACTLAVAGAAFAQGTVNWVTPFSSITAQTNATTISPLFGGGVGDVGGTAGATALGSVGGVPDFYYELLYTTYSGSQATISSLSSLLSWSDTGLGATNNASGTAGRLNPIATSTQAPVPWASGTTQSIVLVGWSSNLGTDWGTVSELLGTATSFAPDSFFGYSTTGYINPGSGNPGVNVFGNSPQSYGLPISSLNTQLYLLPVPEPTTIALAGLGGLSLLLFRRRKV